MTEERRWPTADELRPYRGRVVVIIDARVVHVGDTWTEALTYLSTNGLRADSVFQVPLDPGVDER